MMQQKLTKTLLGIWHPSNRNAYKNETWELSNHRRDIFTLEEDNYISNSSLLLAKVPRSKENRLISISTPYSELRFQQ